MKSASLKTNIEEVLSVLIGEPLVNSFRVCNMQCFKFGKSRKTWSKFRKKAVVTTEFNLHIDCVWRLSRRERIILAYRDYYFRPDNDEVQRQDWDWMVANRYDERNKAFVQSHKEVPLVVKKILADRIGGFRLTFTDGVVLDVFPDNSGKEEFWRFFRSGARKHFVVIGDGDESL